MNRHQDLLELLFAAMALLLLGGCGGSTEAAASTPSAVPVRWAHPSTFTDGTAVAAIGRLEGMDEAQLGFVSAGVLRQVTVDIGDRFRRGAVLAQLDTTALDASLRQAQEQAERAQRDLQRYQPLAARKLIAGQQLDDAQTEVKVAQAAVRGAQFQRRYGQIVAPADGVVMSRLAQPGEVLAAGQPVLVVSSARGGWRMKVEVADRDAVLLAAGLPAKVSFDAFPGRVLAARIREIGGRAAAGSGAITVDLELEAGDVPLRSGLIGRASIPMPVTPTLGIPVSAIASAQGDQAQILLARNGAAVSATVTLGELRGDQIEVLHGLLPSDAVIVEGGAWADAGDAITPARQP